MPEYQTTEEAVAAFKKLAEESSVDELAAHIGYLRGMKHTLPEPAYHAMLEHLAFKLTAKILKENFNGGR